MIVQRSKRLALIKDYVLKHKDVKITELNQVIDASESTIRRDIKTLAQDGFLNELYGSVVLNVQNSPDTFFQERLNQNVSIKKDIGLKAAKTIKDQDVIYIDAGSTTFHMVEAIEAKDITVVTNSIHIAENLANRHINTYIVPGNLKPLTMAIVGEQALEYVRTYNFDKCFMGTNGISKKGYSTPDVKEGILKKAVINHSRECFVLSDSSKDNVSTAYIFASLERCTLIKNI